MSDIKTRFYQNHFDMNRYKLIKHVANISLFNLFRVKLPSFNLGVISFLVRRNLTQHVKSSI